MLRSEACRRCPVWILASLHCVMRAADRPGAVSEAARLPEPGAGVPVARRGPEGRFNVEQARKLLVVARGGRLHALYVLALYLVFDGVRCLVFGGTTSTSIRACWRYGTRCNGSAVSFEGLHRRLGPRIGRSR